jgi:hypothetical protein
MRFYWYRTGTSTYWFLLMLGTGNSTVDIIYLAKGYRYAIVRFKERFLKTDYMNIIINV